MVRDSAQAVVESAERSHALFGDKSDALSQIAMLAAGCAEVGWDGGHASPIDALAVRTASDLVRALPEGLPLPEFAPEPDGSLSLDWIVSRHRLFSMSVGRTNRLAYAWLDGTDKGHAVALFDGVRFPVRLLD
ncbi:MAG TPA: hypothetical protein VGO11_01475, partial [Chthoniobacteraceae bacterium]|nr:hypothetical protein [Chthoniobacteraceae bacterium]